MKIKTKCDQCSKTIFKKQHIVKRNKHNFCCKECYYRWKIGKKIIHYRCRKNDYIMTKAHRMNISKGKKGIKFTQEHKNNLSKSLLGKEGYWTGKKRSKEDIEKFRKSHLGKKQTKKTKEIKNEKLKKIVHNIEWNKKVKLSKIGNKNPNYKGGITPLFSQIRNLSENTNWRKDIFNRDNYICQECFKKSNYIEAHHKKAFAIILQEFLQEYNQFSPIEDKETLIRLAINYKPFWDINNGVTLCKKCHDKITKNQKIKRAN